MARHIGYYNDHRDIRELAGKTPGEIVTHYLSGLGAFHSDKDTTPSYPVQGLRPVKRGKSTYYVQKNVDRKYPDSPDNFIDIYVK